ncbi:DUF456 family protein [Pelosinus propionicus]|uniref:Uncharacterized protein n=1 Tax=Pelosinus propionicus DSM 13327 TaxID=1123291 RepID=A0A1I4KSP0_9FIRM|nr:DUF456 family protein [Pelosinus propionicus]SFL81842.1 Protein of unknown function [Pelosinus propionicus DSM 13327]
MIVQSGILLVMFIGQLCTLAPNFYGTIIILASACLYALLAGVSTYPLWVLITLGALVFVAEIGTRGLRRYLTRNYNVSKTYSVNTTVCNLAGIIVADALLGSIIGLTVWELVVGKALVPYLDSISKILVRLMILAIIRFICGVIMITIICKYLLYI